MAVKMRELLASQINTLRYEPTAKRIRVSLAGTPVVDTYHAQLVWEPRRVVPSYAVPERDLSARLVPAGPEAAADSPPILDPAVPFVVHTCAGASLDIVTDGGTRRAAAFRPADPDLAGYVILEFTAFDWLEEDGPIVAHPHDPFHRIDILPSSRHVRIELDGRVLAESSRALMLFETLLPVRFYLPPGDITAVLELSDTVTFCAYKGRASYLSVPGGAADVAWTYREPLHDALPVRDRIAFFDERTDVTVDGVRRERPTTPWTR